MGFSHTYSASTPLVGVRVGVVGGVGVEARGGEAVRVDQAVQGRAADAEQPGGGRETPVAAGQSAFDRLPFRASPGGAQVQPGFFRRFGSGEFQVRRGDELTFRHQRGAADAVLQLPHVARPAMRRDGFRRVASRAAQPPAELLRVAGQEPAGQQQRVAAALAQRRDAHGHGVQTVEQVAAEAAVLRLLLQRLVGGRHHAHVDLDRPRPPTRSTTWSCRKRSILACSASGRSPISSRNRVPPLAASILPTTWRTAPVKAPRSWPNSSLSSSALRDGGAVERDEGLLGARAQLVQGARQRLLAGAALAQQQHGHRDAGQPLDRAADLQHALVGGDDVADRARARRRGAGGGSPPPASRRRSARSTTVRSTSRSTGFSQKS